MSGEVYCWGGNTHGQLGTGTTSTTPSLSPVKVQNLAGPVATISLGNAHSCALMPRPAASRDGSVRDSLATVSRYGAGILLWSNEIDFAQRGPGSDQLLYEQRGAMFAARAARNPLLGPTTTSILGPDVKVRSPLGNTHGRLVASTDQLAHVRRLAGGAGPGVWLPQNIARTDHVGPGDRVSLDVFRRTVRVRVAGVYEALIQEPPRGYWRHWYDAMNAGPKRSHP